MPIVAIDCPQCEGDGCYSPWPDGPWYPCGLCGGRKFLEIELEEITIEDLEEYAPVHAAQWEKQE